MDSIPAGLCQCGCGQRTNIVPKTMQRLGYVKGQHYPYVVGHRGRLERGHVSPMLSFLIEDRGYSTSCWVWRGSISSNGYGRILYAQRQRQAHLAIYETLRGTVPKGLHLDHLCRVRSCVNPDHLEPVTPAVNLRRGPRIKLTEETVREIRGSSLSNVELAEQFGVSDHTISQVRHRHTWTDV